jgi:hypothetical protein
MRVPVTGLPGEWDHHLPKRKDRGSTLEWKYSKEKIEDKLWGDLAKSTEQFLQAYDLIMSVIQHLQIHHDPIGQENEKNK